MSFVELTRWPLFWIAVVVIAVAQLALIGTAARMGRPAGRATGLALRPRIELAWTLVTAAALSVLLFFTYRALA